MPASTTVPPTPIRSRSDGASPSAEPGVTRQQQEHQARTSQEPAPAPFLQEVEACSHSIYQVVQVIDQGGMGIVYKARDERLNREVAVKVMLPAQRNHPQISRRFIEEAKVTSQLEHPNIIPVHQLGIDAEGNHFFSMKMVHGETLALRLKRWHRIRPTAAMYYQALTIMIKVCDALAFAHSRGVIHRDVKPANIMIGKFGEVLLMDWGIARVRAMPEGPTEHGARDRRAPSQPHHLDGRPPALTLDGEIVGTPGYMSPEQARGDLESIDATSDIYSIGAIMYEILTTQAPATGSAREMIAKTIEGRIPSPRLVNPARNVPRELEAIAMKALCHDPGDRYRSVRDLAQDLASYLAGRSVSVKKDGAGTRLLKLIRRNQALSTALAAALITLLVCVIPMAARFYQQQALRRQSELTRDISKVAAVAQNHRRLQAFAPYSRGIDLLSRGGYDADAISRFRDALTIDPNFTEAHFALGQALLSSGDPRSAAEEFLKTDLLSRKLSAHPNLQALLCAAFAQDDAGFYRQSADSFAQASAVDGAGALSQVGRCFHQGLQGDFSSMLSTATDGERLEPRLWETHFARAYALWTNLVNGEIPPSCYPEVVAELRQAVAMRPREIAPSIWLSTVLASGTPQQVQESLELANQSVASEPKNPVVFAIRSQLECYRGDTVGEHRDFDSLQAMHAPGFLLAEVRALAAQLSCDEEEEYRQLTLQNAEYLPLPTELEFLELGLRLGRSVELADRIAAFHSQHAGTLLDIRLRCIESVTRQDFGAALRFARSGSSLAPYSQVFALYEAQALFGLGRRQEAVQGALRLFTQVPDDIDAGIFLMNSYQELREPEQAAALRKLLESRFPSRRAWLHRPSGKRPDVAPAATPAVPLPPRCGSSSRF